VRVEADSPTAQLLAAPSTKTTIDLLEQTTAPISSGRVLAIGSGATVSVASDVAHKTSQRTLVLAMTALYGFIRAVDTWDVKEALDSDAGCDIEANIGSRVSVRVNTAEQLVIESIMPLLVATTDPDTLVSATPGPALPVGPGHHNKLTPSWHWHEQLRRTPEPDRVVVASAAGTDIDSDVPVTASDPAGGRDSDVMLTGADEMKPVADRQLQRSCVDSSYYGELALMLRPGKFNPSCDSEWREIVLAMANGPGGYLNVLILFSLLFWLPLIELSAAATLVILSGLIFWFDDTAFNFIRLGVESRVYPSRLATPPWINQKGFLCVIRISSRRRIRSIMSGKGKNLRGQYPFDLPSESSQTVSKPKRQGKEAREPRAEAAASEQAAAISRANEILGAVSAPTAGSLYGAAYPEGPVVWQWDSMFSLHNFVSALLSPALGPGSPARQGARHE
jgi:hypothetical protein